MRFLAPPPLGKWWRDDWDGIPEPRERRPARPWPLGNDAMKEHIERGRRGDPMPSTCLDEEWIYATRRGDVDEAVTGKWLIFAEPREVDRVWAVVCVAHARGLLGVDAKVSTALSAAGGQHVVCVYTADWRDEADVMRVREALRALWFDDVLYYKTDEDTRRGSRGHTYKA